MRLFNVDRQEIKIGDYIEHLNENMMVRGIYNNRVVIVSHKTQQAYILDMQEARERIQK